MKAIIQKRKILREVFSASGIEIWNGKLYIIGDDSQYLYIFDISGNIDRKVLLYDSKVAEGTRIPKKEKFDLETLAFIELEKIPYLLTLGSGSKKEKRDKGFLINLFTFEVLNLDLNPVYKQLRQINEIVGTAKLNIEGLASTPLDLVLFTRGNVSGKNVAIIYNKENVLRHLSSPSELLIPKIFSFNLPNIGNYPAGFSGADYNDKNKYFLFTAAVENTDNEIDDGEMLGSFVGIIPYLEGIPGTVQTSIIYENEEIYKGKVESIAILNKDNDSDYNSDKPIKALAVTDSDGGDSELIWLEIFL